MLRFKKKNFMADESGAITVDWVVLCAGLVSLAVLISGQTSDKAVSLGTSVSTYMVAKSP